MNHRFSSAPEPLGGGPDGPRLCRCKDVSRAAVITAIRGGCRSVESVGQCTGAGTGCGRCQAGIRKLLAGRGPQPAGADAGPANGGRWAGIGLLAASLLALVLAGLPALLGPLPFADTVRGGPALDAVWRTRWGKEVSGYAVVVLALSALVLSLRKRWRGFTRGRFAAWRTAHAFCGMTAVVLAALHTGLHSGRNLNLVLMAGFLGFVTAGAAAGIATALEDRWRRPAVGRLRGGCVRVHVLLFWPLPVLLGFHVLAVYYF